MRYAKVIQNTALKEKYLALVKDETLTDLDDDLALLRAMTEMIAAKAFKDDTPVEEFSVEKIAAVTIMLEKIQKLVESITKHKLQMGHLVNVKSLTSLVDTVTSILQRHVTDHVMLTAIVTDLRETSVKQIGDGNAE